MGRPIYGASAPFLLWLPNFSCECPVCPAKFENNELRNKFLNCPINCPFFEKFLPHIWGILDNGEPCLPHTSFALNYPKNRYDSKMNARKSPWMMGQSLAFVFNDLWMLLVVCSKKAERLQNHTLKKQLPPSTNLEKNLAAASTHLEISPKNAETVCTSSIAWSLSPF